MSRREGLLARLRRFLLRQPPPPPPRPGLFTAQQRPVDAGPFGRRVGTADDADGTFGPLFDTPPPPAATDPVEQPAPEAAADPLPAGEDPAPSKVRVHDERLDRRPGPIHMSPSEAIALAAGRTDALNRHRDQR